jgi:heme ABC exporter ATP-binding subunit CcmA
LRPGYAIILERAIASPTTMTTNATPEALSHAPALAIDVQGLSKSFGRMTALRKVDLQLAYGEGLALFGHNGAGKSTLIRTLSTLIRPDDGTVRIAGFDRDKQASQIRSAIGYVGHQSLLYDDLTPRENLRFYAKMYGLPDAHDLVEESLVEVGASTYADRRVRVLSNGMQKRVAIARALLHRPRVLLLDEPETGLDQSGLELLDSVVAAVKQGGASVVMATHGTERGLALAERAMVLADGRVSLACATSDTNVEAIQQAVLAERGARR